MDEVLDEFGVDSNETWTETVDATFYSAVESFSYTENKSPERTFSQAKIEEELAKVENRRKLLLEKLEKKRKVKGTSDDNESSLSSLFFFFLESADETVVLRDNGQRSKTEDEAKVSSQPNATSQKERHDAMLSVTAPTTIPVPSSHAVTISMKSLGKDNYDDFFKISVRNPRIGSVTFEDYCKGLNRIRASDLRVGHAPTGQWVTMGVIIERSDCKKSAKGGEFVIWKIHDLHESAVKVVLFGECAKAHMRLQRGHVVALSSPAYGDPLPNEKHVVLKVSRPTQVIAIGTSMDLGTCKGVRKDQRPCEMFVNIAQSEFCVFHVMNEAKKLSSRRGAFSSTSSQPPKKFTAAPTFPVTAPLKPRSKSSSTLNLEKPRLIHDKNTETRELQEMISTRSKSHFGAKNLTKLRVGSDERGPSSSKADVTGASLRDFLESQRRVVGGQSTTSDVCGVSITSPNTKAMLARTAADMARKKAVEVLRKKKEAVSQPATFKRQCCDTQSPSSSQPAKKAKTELSREEMLKLLDKKSKHEEELNKRENLTWGSELGRDFRDLQTVIHLCTRVTVVQENCEASIRHLDALEKQEKVETFLTDCKAVANYKCNYTAPSQSSYCKQQGHLIQRHTAEKRFFKCKVCSRRTHAFTLLPTHACENWERVAMRDEKKIFLDNEKLLVRGEERKFVNQ